ncbi:hypothetical protein NDA03_02580 [Trichocoleus sp. Lan]|uniref:hypothetical protein n=1 Tax=unclassified Trichocoleus TaxID=2628910 RepID=UPI003299A511
MSQKEEIYLLDEATLNSLTVYWQKNCIKEEDIDKYGFLVSMRDAYKLASRFTEGTPYRDRWFWMLHEFMQDEYNKMTVAQFNLDGISTQLRQDFTRQPFRITPIL